MSSITEHPRSTINQDDVPSHPNARTVQQSSPHSDIVFRLPRVDAPTGRPLHDDEWVEVHWTVAEPEDDEIHNKVARRHRRLLRLLREAKEQDAAPTVGNLATVLDVGGATIKRDLAALRRSGHSIHTRGSRARSNLHPNTMQNRQPPRAK